ncbi:hypothetical protein MC885_016450 [Smutsia gigantea]|nr:hypothetical protein MC885_016450 [Smutsia gigantea]
MAALAPGGPGDAASAALDELSRNFTYGALGAGNGSLSGAWYRRNQKYSHLHLVHQAHPRPFFRSVLWWGGMLLLAIGETGNFAAYGFAPITLIAPLGCMSVTAMKLFLHNIFPSSESSAIISVVFLKENLRASDLLGMTLAFAGTYLLVNFAPNITQSISARRVQYYFVGWQFLIYVILEILAFCILLYFHKRKGMKHIVILLTLVALLASLTVISVKAVSGMITFSVTDKMQLTYPIFYVMFIVMIASCVFQVRFLNQATKLYNTTTVVTVNHMLFTTSAIIAELKKEIGKETGSKNGAEVAHHCYSVPQCLRERVARPADRRASTDNSWPEVRMLCQRPQGPPRLSGIIFYQEFLGAAFLTVFIYLFGCFLSFLGVFLVTRNREKKHLPQSYIDFGNIPGKQMLDKIQPDSDGLSYGTLPNGSDSTKSQSGEKKEV